jgi:flagellar hook-basal body complex protein FliE
MTSTLTTIARTISEELERAVAAAEEAQNAGVDLALKELGSAERARLDALAHCNELEREAASLVSQALKARERAEAEFNNAMESAVSKIEALKVKAKARIANGKKKSPSLRELVNASGEASGELE